MKSTPLTPLLGLSSFVLIPNLLFLLFGFLANARSSFRFFEFVVVTVNFRLRFGKGNRRDEKAVTAAQEIGEVLVVMWVKCWISSCFFLKVSSLIAIRVAICLPALTFKFIGWCQIDSFKKIKYSEYLVFLLGTNNYINIFEMQIKKYRIIK